jgi:hypothetical protein
LKAWLWYAAAALAVTVLGVLIGTRLVPAGAAGAVVFAGALAWIVQLAGFGALVAVRQRSDLFLFGWVSGLILRLGSVAVVALWLSRDPVFPLGPALLSLVAFVFVLLLLEPLFLRRGLQTR